MRSTRFAIVPLFVLCIVATSATAATYTWTGGTSSAFSNQNNWNPIGVPSVSPNIDSLGFPSGPSRLSPSNDLPAGTPFGTIAFNGNNYTLGGNGIVLTSGLTSSGSNNVVNVPIDVQTNAVTISTNSGAFTIGGAISGSGPITIGGTGNWLTIVGNHPYGGTITVEAGSTYGALFLSGATLPNATLNLKYILTGNGTVGPLSTTAGGPYISPGSSQSCCGGNGSGIINTGNLSFTTGSYYVDINGPTPGSGHDQLNATGTVAIGANTTGLYLTMGGSYVPAVGAEIVIVNNDGVDAVSGRFRNPSTGAAYAEGTIVALNGADFRLSYVGGSGNDVSLTCVTSPKSWTGAVSNVWSVAGNWTGGAPIAGDVIQFPAGAANTNNTNNLPAGTSLDTIAFVGNSYSIGGNSVVLTKALTSSGSNNVLNVPIDVQTNAVTINTNGGAFTIGGAISGSGPITIGGTGNWLTIVGNHPYGGTITAEAGSTYGALFLSGATLPNATLNLK
jgi:hypothetical protein